MFLSVNVAELQRRNSKLDGNEFPRHVLQKSCPHRPVRYALLLAARGESHVIVLRACAGLCNESLPAASDVTIRDNPRPSLRCGHLR